MKKILFAVLLFLPLAGFSQAKAYFGAGWNFSYTPIPDLNFVIDEYNEVRPYLSQKMKNVNMLTGPEFSFGGMGEGSMIDIRWSFQHANVTAIVPDTIGVPADNYQRQLKLRANTLSVGFGKAIIKSRFYGGASLCFAPLKLFTRVDRESLIKDTDYDLVTKNTSLGATFFVAYKIAFGKNGKGPGVLFRPFAQLYFGQVNFSDFREIVQPVQHAADPRELLGRPSSVGISLQFCGFY